VQFRPADERAFKKYGIPVSKIEYIVIPEQNQQQALREGIIDIAVLQTAYHGCSRLRLNARSLASSSDALGEAGGMTLLICREDFIETHPETVEKFIKGYKESERWCNDNRKEAGNITAERLGLCEGVLCLIIIAIKETLMRLSCRSGSMNDNARSH
jgi:ABC-type nitrate/sulfonate/bicarbonate transport system substrate-binding protein